MKYSSPDNQAQKASSLSQPLKIHAGRLSANVLSSVMTDLWQAKVRKHKVLAALSCQEQKNPKNTNQPTKNHTETPTAKKNPQT